ncbi:RNA polymerase sigma factor [Winogradskyella tangerina]|uniref:RNA polymerase sigma factor n=1 Tax=Winogradskyella tangerina TaxID=2023240 RepID=UPI000DBE6534|nr:sigma-70 family RNA polymerase sigma factor [Winogradskyella tangerina]
MNEPRYYLEGLVTNNESVVKDIYQKSFRNVIRFVSNNKGRREDAEDIFQKALLQLAVRYKKEKFEIKSSFEAYLFTVCKNLWRRELNKSKLKVTNDAVIELNSEDDDIAVSVLEQKRWELFTEALELISENCKAILKLFFAKVSYAIMVEQFNYNSETVARQRVFKCKNKLKDLVKSDVRYNELKSL